MLAGHQKQWRFFKKSLELNRLSHAYLFSGPEFLGKKTLAIEFIKLINCQNENSDKKPCGQCDFCKMIEKNIYPGLFIVKSDTAFQGREDNLNKRSDQIQISQIREVQHFLSLHSYYGHWKSVIFDEAEKMTPEAQNCLLKTLEEARGRAILILISSYPDLLLPTIYSRCQIIKFFPVSRLEIKNYLSLRGVPEKKAELLSSVSRGKPAKAINFLLNPEKLEKENQILKEILEVCQSDFASRFQYIKNLALSKSGIKDILEILQRYFRDILLSEKSNSYFASKQKIKKNIEFIEKLNSLIFSTNINPKLALEVLMMEF